MGQFSSLRDTKASTSNNKTPSDLRDKGVVLQPLGSTSTSDASAKGPSSVFYRTYGDEEPLV